MFLDPKKIEFTRDYAATEITTGQKTVIPHGTKGAIQQRPEGGDTISTRQVLARIVDKVDDLEKGNQHSLYTRLRGDGHCHWTKNEDPARDQGHY